MMLVKVVLWNDIYYFKVIEQIRELQKKYTLWHKVNDEC